MKYRILIPLALSCCLTACGDDAAGITPDADLQEQADAGVATATIITVGGDYAGSGVLSAVEVPSMEVTINAVAGVVGGDPVLRQFGDRLFILDRFGGDSITVLDRTLTLLGQVTTGAGSNPQDVAVIGDTAYVVALDATGVLVIDLNDITGGVTKTIDLGALDADDGVPDCNSIYAVGTRLFASCQILDRATFSPRSNGKVAVIDTVDDSLELTIDLTAINPFAQFEQLSGGDLVFSTAPGALFGGVNDSGCLERIATTGTPSLLPCQSANAVADAYPSDLVVDGDAILFVNVSAFDAADIRRLDGASLSTLAMSPIGSNISGLAICPTGHLVIVDNTEGARGLRVFDDVGANAGGLLDVGWPEFFAPGNATICW